MQTTVMRAIFAFVIPILALFIEVPLIELAYRHQVRLERMWTVLEALLAAAVMDGWIPQTSVETLSVLASFEKDKALF